MKALERQESGNHYKLLKIQPVEYCLANNLGFLEANVIKYVSRFRHKGAPISCLRKAAHYLEMLIEHELEKSETAKHDLEMLIKHELEKSETANKPAAPFHHQSADPAGLAPVVDAAFDYRLEKSSCPASGCDE